MTQAPTFTCTGATASFVAGTCGPSPIKLGDRFVDVVDPEGEHHPAGLTVRSIVAADGSDTEVLTAGATGRLGFGGPVPAACTAGAVLRTARA